MVPMITPLGVGGVEVLVVTAAVGILYGEWQWIMAGTQVLFPRGTSYDSFCKPLLSLLPMVTHCSWTGRSGLYDTLDRSPGPFTYSFNECNMGLRP